MKRTRSTNSRERVLNAAELVTIRDGVNGLTLEAVAEQAEVSKGGLLYHFPTKDALVQALVSRIATIVEARFAEGLMKQLPGKGRHALTLVSMMLDREGSLFPRLQKVAAPLLAAMATNPGMLNPMRRFFERIHRGMLEDGLPAPRAWLILAALDGLKFWKIFQLMEPSEADLKNLRMLITRIIQEA